jgi:enamine deaminase RidA (YjgF/YER057c/UK114 family)
MRSFVPFGDPWQMPIPVPYSFLVRDENLAWTCGQLSINGTSTVLAPGDLLGQTNIVCDYIEDILARGGLQQESLGKLVLYFVKKEAGDAERMMACCRARFGNRPVLVPIAVPHFYFEDLLLEVDAFAGTPGKPCFERSTDQATINITDGGELAWVSLAVDPDHLVEGRDLLETSLTEFGLSSNDRLCERWIAPCTRNGASTARAVAAALGRIDLITDEGALIESADSNSLLIGEITYVKAPSAPIVIKSHVAGGVKVNMRKIGRFAWFSARSTDGDLALVPQTSQLMASLAEALIAVDMDFEAVVKSTSHYVGGSSNEELFENMTIRNSYYNKPGPASTGLPVSGFADKNSRIAVDFLTVLALPTSKSSDGDME